MNLISITSLLYLHLWGISTSVLGGNPVMTQTSMDVGNIISFVIPESPDTNINVDQLTADFRRQLERIRKQSHASKLEHGLVTLKSALPEMSREEKKKTIPIIRRVLQETRNNKPVKSNQHKEISTNQNKKNSSQNSRRHIASSSPGKKDSGYHKSAGTARSKQPVKNKHKKKPKSTSTRRVTPPQSQKNENFNWKDSTGKDHQGNPQEFQKNSNFNWQNDMNKEPRDNPTMESQKNEGFSWQNSMNNERPENPIESQKNDEMSWQSNVNSARREYPVQSPTNTETTWQNDLNKERTFMTGSTGKPSSSDEKNQHYLKESWNPTVQNEQYRKQPPQFSCSEVSTEATNFEYKIRNPKEANEFEISKDITNDTPTHINNDENYSNPSMYPLNVEIDDFKGFERILQNPEETLGLFNSTTENEQQMKNREDDQLENTPKIMHSEYSEDRQMNSSDDFRNTPNYYESTRDFEVNRQMIPDQIEYPVDPQITRRLVNFGDENMEIRIQRSVDDNSVSRKKLKLQLAKTSENKSVKLKKPWKSYPRSWHKTSFKSIERNSDI